MPIRVLDIIFALFLLGVGIQVVWLSVDYGYIVRNVPGPGFFPFWIGLIIIVMSIFNLMNAVKSDNGDGSDREGVASFKIVGIIAAMGAVILLLPWIGLVIGTGLLIPVIGAIIKGGWDKAFAFRILPTAVIVPTACYFIFARFLNVPLVTGVFGI